MKNAALISPIIFALDNFYISSFDFDERSETETESAVVVLPLSVPLAAMR